ncbi:MAG: hypothetical protein ABII90_07735, partial [Bacteroidota bacterium]
MLKHKYPHFNPEVHKIESKIATVQAGHHCKFNINYRLIWILQIPLGICRPTKLRNNYEVPKYRKHILKGKV